MAGGEDLGGAGWRERLARVWGLLCRWRVVRMAGFLLFMLGFSAVISRLSGLAPLGHHPWIEGPLLLVLYWALGWALRPGKLPAVAAALPLVAFYVASDIYFVSYGEILRLIDIGSLPELMKVLHWLARSGVVLAVAGPVVLWVALVDWRRYGRLLVVVGLALAGAAALELAPGAVIAGLKRVGLEVAIYSDLQSEYDNGRLTMMVYFEATRREAEAQTASYRQRGEFEREVRASVEAVRQEGSRHNVYVVVMESFVDPALFGGVRYSRDPRHPEYAALVGDGAGFSISPVFGGQTAQAEFEALCGVPALASLGEIEFNEFTGRAAGCLPDVLRQAGYATYASNVYQPDYFNSTKAYTGMGFEQVFYPKEYAPDRESYLTVKPLSEVENYLFDGDVFDQQLGFVARMLKEHPGRPMMNYLLTMYGHEPHDMDLTRRPMVLTMEAAQKDEQLLRAANQYWYRTQAVARYIRALEQLDPRSLIVIVSDHLPPLDEGMKSYEAFRYLENAADSVHQNRLLVVEDGQVVRHATIHHYEVAQLVYQYLTGQRYCSRIGCQHTEAEWADRYRLLIARAAGPLTGAEGRSSGPKGPLN